MVNKKTGKCIDCGKEIHKVSTRCKHCSNIAREQNFNRKRRIPIREDEIGKIFRDGQGEYYWENGVKKVKCKCGGLKYINSKKCQKCNTSRHKKIKSK